MSPGGVVVLGEGGKVPEHTKSFETAAAACPAAGSKNENETCPSHERGWRDGRHTFTPPADVTVKSLDCRQITKLYGSTVGGRRFTPVAVIRGAGEMIRGRLDSAGVLEESREKQLFPEYRK